MLRLDIHAILIYKQYDISQIQFKKKKKVTPAVGLIKESKINVLI